MLALFQALIIAAQEPPTGQPLVADGLKAFRFCGSARYAHGQIVQVTGQPFREAWRIRTKERPPAGHDVLITTPFVQPALAGDTLRVSFYARATEASDPGGKGKTFLYIAHNGVATAFAKHLEITNRWTLYQGAARAPAILPAGKGEFTFGFVHPPQVIEIADMKLINYGTNVAPESLPHSGFPAVSYRATDTNVIELLSRIDPQKDVVAGKWTVTTNGLMSDLSPRARVQIPYEPPEEYDFQIVFTRLACTNAGVSQLLPKDGRPFAWHLAAQGNTYFGFDLVDGKWFQNNGTGVRVSECLKLHQRYTSTVAVRKSSVKAFLDGRFITEWRPEMGPLSECPNNPLPNKSYLGFGSYQEQIVIHSATVREVTGKGKFTRTFVSVPKVVLPQQP